MRLIRIFPADDLPSLLARLVFPFITADGRELIEHPVAEDIQAVWLKMGPAHV